jgi:hypothetical protein
MYFIIQGKIRSAMCINPVLKVPPYRATPVLYVTLNGNTHMMPHTMRDKLKPCCTYYGNIVHNGLGVVYPERTLWVHLSNVTLMGSIVFTKKKQKEVVPR